MTKILFITSTRIGDAILSTGILNELITQHPNAKITVACGTLVEGFFSAAPNVERVIALKKLPRAGHWRKLWAQTFKTRWDIVVDLRNSAVSRLIFAKKRYIFGRHINQTLHKAEQNAQLLNLAQTPPLKLFLPQTAKDEAEKLIPSGSPVLGIAPAANWRAKTWPAERFIELANRLTAPNGIMAGARIAIIAAPGEERVANQVLAALSDTAPSHGGCIDIIAKGRPELAAACVARCDFFIGNDSGLAHAAAAANIPVLALFGPSWPHLYRPYSPKSAYISTQQNFAELTSYEGYTPSKAPCLMESLSVDAVEGAANQLFTRLKAQNTVG